jgi:ribosomal protein S21
MGKIVNVEVRRRDKREHPDAIIKRFMKKVKNSKILDLYRERMRYQKPSDKRRRQKARRKKVLEKLHNQKIKENQTTN